jgi:hypothetical protein
MNTTLSTRQSHRSATDALVILRLCFLSMLVAVLTASGSMQTDAVPAGDDDGDLANANFQFRPQTMTAMITPELDIEMA